MKRLWHGIFKTFVNKQYLQYLLTVVYYTINNQSIIESLLNFWKYKIYISKMDYKLIKLGEIKRLLKSKLMIGILVVV